MFVYGTGGMGKTHLLHDVILTLDKEPIYFLAHQNSDLLELYELCFGSYVGGPDKNKIYRAFLRKFEDEECSLVIDDYYEVSDRFLAQAIINLSNVRKGKLVVISRSLDRVLTRDHSRDSLLKVNKLDEAAFREYISYYYEHHLELHDKVTLDDALEDQFYSILRGYPLGVKFIFDLFAYTGAHSSVIENLEEFDEEKDVEGKLIMGRLLDAVVKHGDPEEYNLLKELSVFITPFESSMVNQLPAFSNQETYRSLIRKDFVWELEEDMIELHALVRELLYDKNTNKTELNQIAGSYYEQKSIESDLDDVESFKLASFHFSHADEHSFNEFERRQNALFGNSIQIKRLISDNLDSSIERLKYRIELLPSVTAHLRCQDRAA